MSAPMAIGKISNPFEVGVVMAGGNSPGGHHPSAVAFLILALDEWHRAKERKEPDCPPHEVRLKVLSGASAGGMTAAIAAVLLGEQFDHDPKPAGNNKLFKSWVQDITIARLLETKDLRGT